jgi:hypothetical protein
MTPPATLVALHDPVETTAAANPAARYGKEIIIGRDQDAAETGSAFEKDFIGDV